MIAVVIETAAVLDRRRDPDGGEAQVADIVQPLDQSLEIAAPVRVLRLRPSERSNLMRSRQKKLLLGSPS